MNISGTHIPILAIVVILLFLFSISSCCKEEELEESAVLGTVTVPLDASKELVRSRETKIGNLVADAIWEDVGEMGNIADIAVVNGGSIRFNAEKRTDGIYPAGPITNDMVEEMLPFDNFSVIVTLTGTELKEVFERSVSALPLAKGWFLQVSENVKLVADTGLQPQIIDETVNPPVIVVKGNRVVSLTINGQSIDSTAIYKILVPEFIAEGNDGYITFARIQEDWKKTIPEDQSNSVKEYLIVNSPVTPEIIGRIILK